MTEGSSLAGVRFASDLALAEAIRAGLTAADFRGVEPDRASGISVALVRTLLAGGEDLDHLERLGPEVWPEEWEAGYRVSRWLGHISYHCLTCPFGTLDPEEIERHTIRHAKRHRAAR